LKTIRHILFFVSVTAVCLGQDARLPDSLETVIKQHPKDTSGVNALNDIAWYYRNAGESEKAKLYAGKAITLAKQIDFKKGLAKAKNALGVLYMDEGDFNEAFLFYNEALKIRTQIDDKPGIAWTYNNIGVVLEKQGKYDLALKNHFTALRIRESISDQPGVAASYNNIGQIYMSLNNYAEALHYCMLSLQIKKKINPTAQSVAQSYTNLGIIYNHLKNNEAALNSYTQALAISLANNSKRSIANLYNNIATVYNNKGEYDKSIEYSLMSLEIKKKTGDKPGISSSLSNIGTSHFLKKNYSAARNYMQQSLALNRELGNKQGIENDFFFLAQVDSSQQLFKNAYEEYKMHVVYRDSLVNEDNRKKAMEARLQYEFDKKAAADSVKTEESKKVLTLQLAQEKTQRFALYGGMALVVMFAGFMFNRFRITRKQKKIIEVQKIEVEKQKDIIEQAKEIVESKQVEILDSIKYAKTLQEAILPSLKEIEYYLPHSFLYYKPKDIIAGDFYWMHVSPGTGIQNTGKSAAVRGYDKLFIAAADCTGHGVPGAMVSVVCSNALNRAVKEFGITEPGEILNKTRELVIETFEKSDKEVKDGMDIALCSIQRDRENKFILKYAGANNPLWYLKENTFYEIKGDKQPIGKHIRQNVFTTHTIELGAGDTFYIFTDGYPDQFGGERGKKFKYKHLQELILQHSEKSMSSQKDILDHTFKTWKGRLEQVDDVCIIGVRL
jgi:tetratricopeptide (TPR) repeat protein/serine phosphatase RsbU (regulator of sigma subunit)